tara:strand:- start:4479 stop:4784 length:306 start_codon:yes stop_codon:yes gene_type:complete
MQIDQSVVLIQDLSEEIYKLKDDRKILDSRILEIDAEIKSFLSDFYNLAEAGDRLNESPQSLLRSIRAGRYTGVNYGGRWYIKADQIRDEAEIKRRLERGV